MDIQISNYLALNILDMIVVLISTAIILFVGKKYFWSVIMDYFQKREAFVEGELSAARHNRESSEATLAKYRETMNNAKGEAQELMDQAKHAAEMERRAILEKAKNEAEIVKAQAQQEIEKQKVAQAKVIKEEMSEIAFLAAQKFVSKELDETNYKEYIDEFIEHAGNESWPV